MKHLKIFENFKETEIEKLYNQYIPGRYGINEDGSIDTDWFIDIRNKKLDKIPIKFNRVNEFFNCSNNKLTTLENSPKYVGQDFDCSNNRLSSLMNGPEHVGGNKYLCGNNNLKDVYGFPIYYKGSIDIVRNPVCEILNLSIVNYGSTKYAPINMEILSVYESLTPILIRFIKIINEYTVIRNQNTVIESRLLDALSEIGMNNLPEGLFFKNYKLI